MKMNCMRFILILSLFHAVSGFARELPMFQLDRLDGSQYDSREDTGKNIILLEFWSSCCKARVSELKYLETLSREYAKRGLKVYAINVDNARGHSRVKPVVKRYKFTFPVLLDPDMTVLRKFSPQKTKPYTVLVGIDGRIIREIKGENPGKEHLIRALIEELLAR